MQSCDAGLEDACHLSLRTASALAECAGGAPCASSSNSTLTSRYIAIRSMSRPQNQDTYGRMRLPMSPGMYPEEFVQPMRTELTQIGFQELRTPSDVDEQLTQKGTTLVVV